MPLRVRRSRVRDAAANRHGWASWGFHTAPGVTYDPARTGLLEVRRHTAYRIRTGADLADPLMRGWSTRTRVEIGQRARMANLPGRWLYVEDGYFTGRWLRESAGAHLRGTSERVSYPADTRIRIRAGTHVGYRFDAAGRVTDSRSRTLASTTTATTGARLVINGVPYLSVTNGTWTGYLLPESSTVHRRGSIDRIAFPDLPRIAFRAGTHTGYRYRPNGSIRSRVTETLSSASGAHARAWAVINGVPHFLVDDGIWAGTWVPESGAIRMDV